MSDVYQRLAARLDEFPNGYPATESGVELKILEHIFTEEEAETALLLRPMPETAEEAAKRLDKPVEAMRDKLDGMAGKGQIGCFKVAGRQVYLLMPFVVGIYEFQLNRLDETLAKLFKAYRPALVKFLGGTRPALARVVPVNVSIEAEHQVLRYEDMRSMIEEARSYRVLPERCIGCGVCTVTCPTESITLERRPVTEQDLPPANLVEWNIERTASRQAKKT